MLFRNRRSPERRRTRSPRSWRTRVAGLAAAALALALSLVQANVGFAAADRGAAEVAPRAAADVVRVAEFLAECPYTHRAPDDPIIFPGLPGASHMHSFFGNVDPSQDFANCPAGTMLESYLDFPQCWNGTDLDSADKSHMAYPGRGRVPLDPPGAGAQAPPGAALSGQRRPGPLPAGVGPRFHDARRLLQRMAGGGAGAART